MMHFWYSIPGYYSVVWADSVVQKSQRYPTRIGILCNYDCRKYYLKIIYRIQGDLATQCRKCPASDAVS